MAALLVRADVALCLAPLAEEVGLRVMRIEPRRLVTAGDQARQLSRDQAGAPVTGPPPAAAMRATAGERLDGHRHVMRVGVEQRLRVAHDPDMARPRRPGRRGCSGASAGERRAEQRRLHVGVARRGVRPAASSASCTSAEQSSPRALRPPQR